MTAHWLNEQNASQQFIYRKCHISWMQA